MCTVMSQPSVYRISVSKWTVKLYQVFIINYDTCIDCRWIIILTDFTKGMIPSRSFLNGTRSLKTVLFENIYVCTCLQYAYYIFGMLYSLFFFVDDVRNLFKYVVIPLKAIPATDHWHPALRRTRTILIQILHRDRLHRVFLDSILGVVQASSYLIIMFYSLDAVLRPGHPLSAHRNNESAARGLHSMATYGHTLYSVKFWWFFWFKVIESYKKYHHRPIVVHCGI